MSSKTYIDFEFLNDLFIREIEECFKKEAFHFKRFAEGQIEYCVYLDLRESCHDRAGTLEEIYSYLHRQIDTIGKKIEDR